MHIGNSKSIRREEEPQTSIKLVAEAYGLDDAMIVVLLIEKGENKRSHSLKMINHQNKNKAQ
jgi:hypothetical protein